MQDTIDRIDTKTQDSNNTETVNTREVIDFLKLGFVPGVKIDLQELFRNLKSDKFPGLTTQQFVQSMYALVYNPKEPDNQRVTTKYGDVFDFKNYATASFSMIRYLDNPNTPESINLENATKLLDKVYTSFRGASITMCVNNFLTQTNPNNLFKKLHNLFFRKKPEEEFIAFVNSDKFFESMIAFSPELKDFLFDGQVGGTNPRIIKSVLTKSGLSLDQVKEILRIDEIKQDLITNASKIVSNYDHSINKSEGLGAFPRFDSGQFNGLKFDTEELKSPKGDNLIELRKQMYEVGKMIAELEKEQIDLQKQLVVDPQNQQIADNLNATSKSILSYKKDLAEAEAKAAFRSNDLDSYYDSKTTKEAIIKEKRLEYFGELAQKLLGRDSQNNPENDDPETNSTTSQESTETQTTNSTSAEIDDSNELGESEEIEDFRNQEIESEVEIQSSTDEPQTDVTEDPTQSEKIDLSIEDRLNKTFEISGQKFTLSVLIEKIKNSDPMIIQLVRLLPQTIHAQVIKSSQTFYVDAIKAFGVKQRPIPMMLNDLVGMLENSDIENQNKILDTVEKLFYLPQILEIKDKVDNLASKIPAGTRSYPAKYDVAIKTLKVGFTRTDNLFRVFLQKDSYNFINALTSDLALFQEYVDGVNPDSSDSTGVDSDEPIQETPISQTENQSESSTVSPETKTFSKEQVESMTQSIMARSLAYGSFLDGKGRNFEGVFGNHKIGDEVEIQIPIAGSKKFQKQKITLTQQFITEVVNNLLNSVDKIRLVYANRRGDLIRDSDIRYLTLEEFYASNYFKKGGFEARLVSVDSKDFQEAFGAKTQPLPIPNTPTPNPVSEDTSKTDESHSVDLEEDYYENTLVTKVGNQWEYPNGTIFVGMPGGAEKHNERIQNGQNSSETITSETIKQYSPEMIRDGLKNFIDNISKLQPKNIKGGNREILSKSIPFNKNEEMVQKLVYMLNPTDMDMKPGSAMYHKNRLEATEIEYFGNVKTLLQTERNSPLDIFTDLLAPIGNRSGSNNQVDQRSLKTDYIGYSLIANTLESLSEPLKTKIENFLRVENYQGVYTKYQSEYKQKFISSLSQSELNTLNEGIAKVIGL